MQEARIAPGLLIAMPQLQDPNFAHGVVLMVEHDQGGSFGLVINRPGNVAVRELLMGLELPWAGAPDLHVGIGGPVMRGTLWLLHEPGDLPADPGMRSVCSGITLSSSRSQLETIARRPPARLRMLLGYAGWGPGQLEQELVEGAWLHAAATPELVFDTPPEQQWRAALDSLGVDPAALVSVSGRN